MAQVVWTERARQDLKEIVEYISRDSKASTTSRPDSAQVDSREVSGHFG
jgi:plasmid stabilization system protein ParE